MQIRRATWGLLAVLGYILSPLSWWNDLWINLPLAYAVANLAHAAGARMFLPTFIAAYWATNLLGLILMHVGIRGAATEKVPAFNSAGTYWWLALSLGYTAAIAVLVRLEILRPVGDYFAAPP